MGSALVALVNVPVEMALRNRVGTLARDLVPITEEDDGKAVIERLAGRKELVKLVLGAGYLRRALGESRRGHTASYGRHRHQELLTG